MFQPNVLFTDYSYNPRSRKARPDEGLVTRDSPNSLMLAEGEEGTATRLGRPKGAKKVEGFKVIHRAPSVEEGTATRLGSLLLMHDHKKINRKNAPNELSLCCSTKTKQGG